MIAYYTIPKTIRELQQYVGAAACRAYYTIPKTIRELQLELPAYEENTDYTIPKTIRELQPYRPAQSHRFGLYHTKNYQGTTTGASCGQY